jgi:glycerol-3-phosphate dehydrogenase subunit B
VSNVAQGQTRVDLAVVGTGLAGLAAAMFARSRGLSVALVGSTGASFFSSGLLDLLSVHPVGAGTLWDDPFAAVAALARDEPRHPYVRVSREAIESAFDEFATILQRSGLPYHGIDGENLRVLTPVGTVKRTYRVPASVGNADYGLRHTSPGLLVDFERFQGYSAAQISETARAVWPGLRTVRLPFPETRGTLYAEHMAMALESEPIRRELVESLLPHLGSAEVVGFPAVLGVYKPHKVYTEVERLLGVRVFEIPTMPPGVAGLRLKSALEDRYTRDGGHLFSQNLVRGVRMDHGEFVLHIGCESTETMIRARGAVLATGRFFGKGLRAERGEVLETVFGLPVHQPDSRADWHSLEMFSPGGHAVNRAGLETDERFRPLGRSGGPAEKALYAAGSILAHQDWMRQKCGAGLAIVTAHAAVDHFSRSLGRNGPAQGD